jgi:hypothetical protein
MISGEVTDHAFGTQDNLRIIRTQNPDSYRGHSGLLQVEPSAQHAAYFPIAIKPLSTDLDS